MMINCMFKLNKTNDSDINTYAHEYCGYFIE